ncbi:MAG: CPBP family intramembrane metalloprotease [Polyangiaceae bacterium]|nr:CPBP family intramembrane metalloprotease [Polyangiaceae bacterium]
MAPLATDLERPKLPGAAPDPESFLAKPGALVELGLTFPLFLLYHLGVVFLGIQNATDFLTHGLMVAAEGNTGRYLGITAAIGVIFVGAFVLLSRGQRFAPIKFGQVAVEGAVYALIMRVGAAYVVGRLFAGAIQEQGRFTGFIMSLGAGFYEEIAFRVVLFGLGAKLLVWFWTGKRMKLVGSSDFSFSPRIIGLMLLWAVVSACVFSGVHYVGALGDPFSLKSFLFRALLGLALTLIYATRGFAAAVWTHALYDVWVLVIAGK